MLRSMFDLEVTGLERLPAEGPFILASNHHNYLDAVVLGVAVPRPINFLVMPRVFRASPLHPSFHRRVGSIPVNLERPDPGAIKRSLRVLEDGGVVGIFPEGPFSREGRLVSGQPGVAMIALRSGVPVVPAAISGTYEALAGRRFYIPRSYPLAVRFGQPLHFHQTRRRRANHANREEITRRIMSHIAALLDADAAPAAQRGEAGGS
jgi:1-acyl-sn-glycerol-3-phosphate acyltransferase